MRAHKVISIMLLLLICTSVLSMSATAAAPNRLTLYVYYQDGWYSRPAPYSSVHVDGVIAGMTNGNGYVTLTVQSGVSHRVSAQHYRIEKLRWYRGSSTYGPYAAGQSPSTSLRLS